MRRFPPRLRLTILTPLALATALGGCTFDTPFGARPAATEPAAPAMVPAPPPKAEPARPAPLSPLAANDSPFPATATVTGPAAVRLLAGDPIALRFLTIRRLLADGLITPDDAKQRVDANIGGLLPLTAAPPAVGLTAPIPSPPSLVARMRALGDEAGTGVAAEKKFLLDSILPAAPAERQALRPADPAAARALPARLDRLVETGLITPPEAAAEKAALARFIAQPAQTPKLEPKPAKIVRRKGPPRPAPYQGFKPVYVPNPPGVAPPPLKAGFTGPAGVQLLAMAARAYGPRAWDTLSHMYPALAPLSYKVVKASLGDLGTTYRLIAGPLKPDAAIALCKSLTAKGQSCTPTPFPK